MQGQKYNWGDPALNVALLFFGWVIYGMLDRVKGVLRAGDDRYGV